MDPSHSFDEFYRLVRDRLVGALTASVGDVDLAADAVDEAMARAYARWGRVGRHPEPAGWVFVTARNAARRTAKRQPPSSGLGGDKPVDGPAGETWLLLRDLPHRQREAVVLRHIAGLTESAIGEVMGVTRGTVSSTLRDAYQTLKSALSEPDELTERQS